MIYSVLIDVPRIYEEVVLAAENEEEAKRLALASAVNRAAETATVTVTPVPDKSPPEAA
jgi:capsular polysaccharide biosynthesis protein